MIGMKIINLPIAMAVPEKLSLGQDD